MATIISLKDFMEEYGESMAERVAGDLSVIHNPSTDKEEEISQLLSNMKKQPFPSQAEIIKACYKSFISGNKAVYLTAECGTGKTLKSIGLAYVLHEQARIRRVLVLCPPTLVRKWIAEIKDSLPGVKAYNLNGRDVITRLEAMRKGPKTSNLEFYVIGRERAKTGFLWRPAVVTRNGHHFCPRCGQELLDRDGYPLPVFERTSHGRFKKKHSCGNMVLKWVFNHEAGEYRRLEVTCGEPLWQPDNMRKNYRKMIPAKFIKEKMKGFYDLLIADEVHQFKNQSGQGYAFGALAGACRYVLCLTGTLAGGYSSDVYYLLFRTHPRLMIEDENKWGNPKSFIERYGVLEKITTIKEEDGLTTKAKRRTIVKEKPGISPLLLGKMLLSKSVFLRLSDVMDRLQPYEEDVIELGMPQQMAQAYAEFEDTLKEALMNALAKGDNSLLGVYLHSLLSYPERIYEGIKVIHPHTDELVANGPPLQGTMPKERELLSIIENELAQKRKVLVYIQNSDTTDISPRLMDMLENHGVKSRMLRSGDTEGRARIIDNWLKKGMEVLITNPRKVEVGMDLLDFPTIVFYQVPMSTYTLRQASRRSWRIPQKRPVKVYFLAYSGTMQIRLMELMAQKLTSSLALEGELTDQGLAALSKSSDSIAIELVKMLVEKSGSGKNPCLRDIWADYRKKEIQAEIQLTRETLDPNSKRGTVSREEKHELTPEIGKVSLEAEKIGDRVIKVQFIEYTGKRKKKVTHIEVKEDELDDMLSRAGNCVQAQFSLF